VDVTSSLVLYGSTGSVRTVMVDGETVKEEGRVTTVDTSRCLEEAQALCESVWERLFRDQPELRETVGK
jgi:cytosine/adenosine deaminase-related metal-dependent hydrolase